MDLDFPFTLPVLRWVCFEIDSTDSSVKESLGNWCNQEVSAVASIVEHWRPSSEVDQRKLCIQMCVFVHSMHAFGA